MKILVTSDHHGSPESFHKTFVKAKKEQPDTLAICGDITHFGSLKEAKELMSPLADLRFPIFIVPGNCDPLSLTEDCVPGINSIHGRCQACGDFFFVGIGSGTQSPFNTPFELTEEEIKNKLAQGFKYCPIKHPFILVSHSPPRNTKLDRTLTGKHVGSLSLRMFIEKEKPSLILCGHIHEALGTDKIGKITLVNPGPARNGCCAIVKINENNEDIEVKLSRLG